MTNARTTALMFVPVALGLAGCVHTPRDTGHAGEPAHAVMYDDIKWGALNPARGDSSPRAGALWGDRTSDGPSGFLVRFVDGFSSPPHIHNVTYRGGVISGLVHNNDPDAESAWMPRKPRRQPSATAA